MQIADNRLQNGTRAVKSPVIKRSIIVGCHKTSVSLEDAFWTGLKEIASARHLTLSDMVSAIDSERRLGNLSSAIRLFVLDFYRRQPSGLKARWQSDNPKPAPQGKDQVLLHLVSPDPEAGQQGAS
jgi:predicted DNA-binding ribbon-helix-helix protein